MNIQTQYGVCNNVDINHIKEYQCGIDKLDLASFYKYTEALRHCV